MREVASLLPVATTRSVAAGRVIVAPPARGACDPRPLLDLHSADDLLGEVVVVAHRRGGDVLARLAEAVAAAPLLDEAVAARWAFRAAGKALGPARPWARVARWAASWPPPPRPEGVPRRPSYRVAARLEGRQPFQRTDVWRAVQEGLSRRFPTWVHRPDGAADLEFVVWLTGQTGCLALRLVESGFARRHWKVAHLPASLPPSVAYALVQFASTEAGEVVLDPFCGAGTILVERGLALPPPALLLGGDINAEARAAAHANASAARVEVDLHDWDARSLPLGASSVDAVVTNPPFGRRHGDPAALPELYAAFLGEAARILRPHGRCVILTTQTELMEQVVGPSAVLAVHGRWPIDLLGIAAQAYLLRPV